MMQVPVKNEMPEYGTLTEKLICEIQQLLGKENVLKEKEELYCYSLDATAMNGTPYYPDLVVLPATIEEVQAVVKLAATYKIPIIPRGAGTNLCGGCVPTSGGIVMHFSRMDKLVSIDKENLLCTVQPGLSTELLQKEVEKLGLFYPPDPASLKVSTIGGNIAESSSGPRCLKYGGTKDYVLGLKVVLADGQIVETGGYTVKNVTGYNLTQLMVGSEGTLGIICEAILKLLPKPEYKKTILAIFDSIDDAAKTVSETIAAKIIPTTLEIMDKNTMRTIEEYSPVGFPANAEASLLIEVDGIEAAVEHQAAQIVDICKEMGAASLRIASDFEESEELWKSRRAAFGAVSRLKPNVIVEDVTVPRSKIPAMVRKIQELSEKYDITMCLVGHAGDGNLHPNIACDLRDEEEMKRVEIINEEMFKYALTLGGTLSGEHGIGMAKAPFLKDALTQPTIDLMKGLKQYLDPHNILNPGKIW